MANYNSTHTGAEIDAAVTKANSITSTAAQIDTAVGDATKVVANPTLAGTESDLTGIQVGTTKYKISSGGGGGVHQHNIELHFYNQTSNDYAVRFTVVCDRAEAFTSYSQLQSYLYTNTNIMFPATGVCRVNNDHNFIDRVLITSSTSQINVSCHVIESTKPAGSSYYAIFSPGYNLTPTDFTDYVI